MSKKKDCPFCRELKNFKELAVCRNDKYRNGWETAIVQKSYYKSSEGEICTGKATYYGYELNFCPTCGKSLLEEK